MYVNHSHLLIYRGAWQETSILKMNAADYSIYITLHNVAGLSAALNMHVHIYTSLAAMT